jgi:hypothetical protein
LSCRVVFQRSMLPPFSFSMDLWNVGILPQHCKTLQSTRSRLEIWAPWKPQNSQQNTFCSRLVYYVLPLLSVCLSFLSCHTYSFLFLCILSHNYRSVQLVRISPAQAIN